MEEIIKNVSTSITCLENYLLNDDIGALDQALTALNSCTLRIRRLMAIEEDIMGVVRDLARDMDSHEACELVKMVRKDLISFVASLERKEVA